MLESALATSWVEPVFALISLRQFLCIFSGSSSTAPCLSMFAAGSALPRQGLSGKPALVSVGELLEVGEPATGRRTWQGSTVSFKYIPS